MKFSEAIDITWSLAKVRIAIQAYERQIEKLEDMLWYDIQSHYASEKFLGDEIFEIFPENRETILKVYRKRGEHHLPEEVRNG